MEAEVLSISQETFEVYPRKPRKHPFEYVETGGGETVVSLSWDGLEIECGEVKGWVNCEKGHRRSMINRCYRQVCPTCWEAWLKRQSEAITRRFLFVMQSTGLAQRHMIVSFHYMPKTIEEYSSMRKKAIKILKELGIKGGMLVGHKHERSDGSRGIHFHSIGIGRIDRRRVKDIYFKTGIVVKDIQGIRRISGVAGYELDHAITVPGRHTVSWFGIMHGVYLRVEKEEMKEIATCPCCGRRMYEERVIWHDDYYSEENPWHYEVITMYLFSWRRKPG